MDDEERRLLSTAHAVVRESQRRLHGLAEEARLLYQRRLNEWEQSRHSLEQVTALLNSQTVGVEANVRGEVGLEARDSLLEDQASLRDSYGDLTEKVYRLQRMVRVLGITIRHLEQEGGRLRQGGEELLQAGDEENLEADSHDRIIQAYEQERLRLAREIHDGPAQILANAIFELEYFERLIDKDPGSVKEHLTQLKRDIRDGLTEVRRFIFDLRPPSLSDMGLFGALRRYSEDFEKHFGVTIEAKLPQIRDRLPSSTEVALFRIVQEALQNVQKHAAASRVILEGRIEAGVLHLSLEDNGRGFDLAEVASRHSRNLGLISMRERAGLIDAQLQITAAPSHGTKIALVVPLECSTS